MQAVATQPVVERRALAGAAWPGGVCLAVAVVSLVLPATLAFDPWAWLVWGREVAHLDLDTTGGPSWKPLPVVVTTVLSVSGGLAPTLWLVVARTLGLLGLVFAYRLAARFSGRVGGIVAAALLLLTPDGGPRFLRLLAEGHSAPVEAALCLWAIERHLDGRRAHALLLGTAVALLRPEIWPFLVVYAAWLWRQDAVHRRLVAVLLAAVPLLWFGGDLWGSGDAWHGADAAQVVSGDVVDRTGLALRRVANVVVLPAWAMAVVALVSARRRGEATPLALAGGAVAWLALVAAMSVGLGYAALSRFLLPAAALLCVLAGVGVVRALAAVPPDRVGRILAAGLVALGVVAVLPRVVALETLAGDVRTRARLESDLERVVDQVGGPDAVLACGGIAVDRSDVPRMALAWRLDVPLSHVPPRLGDGPGVVFARVGSRRDVLLSGEPSSEVATLARSAEWVAYAVGCQPALR
ncbi:MAG: hypothetical protein ACRD2C_07210 [Acidimicrobiales bacterium]